MRQNNNNNKRLAVRKRNNVQVIQQKPRVSSPRRSIQLKVHPFERYGDYTTYTSNAGGQIAAVHVLNPNALSDWSDFQGVYSAVQILYMEVFLTPLSLSGGITYLYGDINSSSVPTITSMRSVNSGQYQNSQLNATTRQYNGIYNTGLRVRVPYPKMIENDNVNLYFKWQPTGGPIQPVWFKLYTDAANCGSPAAATLLWSVRVCYHFLLRLQT